MKPLSAILALLVAIAGWHYMFYSRAAHRLGVVEAAPANLQRIRLRRINGFVMFLLAICIFAVGWTFDWRVSPSAFVIISFIVFVLLMLMVLLALLDLRLTHRLRRRRNPDQSEGNTP